MVGSISDRHGRVVAVIQARMGSTRLPGKVLADLCGRPLLERVIMRARTARRVDEFCVATTRQPEDDAVAGLAERLGVRVTRGDVDDVLARYLAAAAAHDAGTIVRLTADNPLIDGGTIDRVVDAYIAAPGLAYARTSPRTYPVGLTAEVVARDALERSAAATQAPADREHVTQYVQRHPELFPAMMVECEFDGAGQRWTVDTPADLERVRAVFGGLQLDRVDRSPAEIAEWFHRDILNMPPTSAEQ